MLTTRANGQTITPSFVNDFKDLFTGVMTDQEVSVVNNVAVQQIGATPAAPIANAVAGSGLGIGAYKYVVAFACGDGETAGSAQASVTTTTGNQKVNLTAIATGPTGTTSRKLYRGPVSDATNMFYLATINDNVTTTYTDTTPDASLGTYRAQLNSTFGGSITFKDNSGSQLITLGATPTSLMLWPPQNDSQVVALVVPRFGGLGVKQTNGTKLMEAKSNGNFMIGGNQYQTQGTYGTAGSQTFDGFDVGEVFKCDQPYPSGTVVCPGPNEELTLCTHDNCHCAMVLSFVPGLGLGTPDDANGVHYAALAGRVMVKTDADMGYRVLVCSDGKGGVRPLYPDEPSYTIGFTLTPTKDGMVGVMLRPMYCTKQ